MVGKVILCQNDCGIFIEKVGNLVILDVYYFERKRSFWSRFKSALRVLFHGLGNRLVLNEIALSQLKEL